MRKETFLRLATEEEAEEFSNSTFKGMAIKTAMQNCTNADAMRGIIEAQNQYIKEDVRMWAEISKSLDRIPGVENLSFNRNTNEISLIEIIPDECEAANE